jgi:hypothetical protein
LRVSDESLIAGSSSVEALDVLAYGFRWLGAQAHSGSLGPNSPMGWPTWRVLENTGARVDVDGWDSVEVPLYGGRVVLQRSRRAVVVETPRPLPAPLFLHPYLSSLAAVASWWGGATPLHAGWFLLDGQAVGVLGGSEQGKSSLLAALASVGHLIGADDLLVTRGSRVTAGPRVLDLRSGAGEMFGTVPAADLEVAGRRRWRLSLAVCPWEAPLAALVTLAWSDGPAIDRIGSAERIRVLNSARALQLGEDPAGALALLDLARLPMLRMARPRSLDDLSASAVRLVDELRFQLS